MILCQMRDLEGTEAALIVRDRPMLLGLVVV